MHVYADFAAEISTSSTWGQSLNNSTPLLVANSSLRLLSCYLYYFIKHSFRFSLVLNTTDFTGSSFLKLMVLAVGVINYQYYKHD